MAAIHREVMRETLDAHDVALIEKVGFERACLESLDDLVDVESLDSIRLAADKEGKIVGYVSGHVRPNGRSFVDFVGVGAEHRRRGYGRQILAWQTRRLVTSGARILVAVRQDFTKTLSLA